ncbi:hypothetical protein L1987_54681 [Smallanthus sonchifolius]|uniref:Uncharacterized protein n=1 Tax=Smallanthus sonchifolius TaxID=185202 RepID=A0ACB9E7E5_9ASTR|nr:hypothetical protein L1987_54681 [Smallanthus sonchifolius]
MGGPNLVENVAPPARCCDYKAFRGCDPPLLTGEKEASDTLYWINGEAVHWWETVKQANGDQEVGLMRWSDLKALVTEKFCPKNKVYKEEREFLTLQAGLMTHRQYTSKYNELARLVPHLVTTEERRIHYYVQGLPPKIHTFVKSNTPSTIESVVVLSGVVYDDIASEIIAEAPKKHVRPQIREASLVGFTHPNVKVRVFAGKQILRSYQVRMKRILRTYQVRMNKVLRTYQVRKKQTLGIYQVRKKQSMRIYQVRKKQSMCSYQVRKKQSMCT